MKELIKEITVKRHEMINQIEKLGLLSPKVLAISQELDVLINQYQMKKMKEKK